MSQLKKTIELKLDVLKATRKTLLKPSVTGSIKEQQENQAARLEKELLDLGVNPARIKKAC